MCQQGRSGAHLTAQGIRRRIGTPSVQFWPVILSNLMPVLTPLSRNVVRDWWERVARLAKLPVGERYGWHSLRRGWASAMRDVSPREMIDLGGWASYDTPLKCYIRPDLEAQRGAFAKRRSLRAIPSVTQAEEGVA